MNRHCNLVTDNNGKHAYNGKSTHCPVYTSTLYYLEAVGYHHKQKIINVLKLSAWMNYRLRINTAKLELYDWMNYRLAVPNLSLNDTNAEK